MHIHPRQAFFAHLAQTSSSPMNIHIVKAEGNYLFDADGQRYLDLIAGIGVCNIGHQHPKVVAVVQEQSANFMHVMVYGETIQSPQSLFAHNLVQYLPPSLDCCYFVNSGAEAIDGAMKLAKRVTGKTDFVAQTDAYHGSSQGPLSLMSNEYYSQAYRPLLPSVHFIAQDDIEGLENIPWSRVAAVVVELIQAERGAKPSGKEFIASLRDKCTQHGSLLIFDEIQTAMGRTGTLFAFEQYGVIPDVLVLGKAIGGGMPMGAFIASRKRMHTLSENPILGHLTTFGGHPVVAAAGNAAFEVLLEEKLMDEVSVKEQLFRRLLQHERIRAIHGKGLLLAIELSDHEEVSSLIQTMLSRGIFADWFLYAPHCLRIAPPLTITGDEIAFACSSITEILDEI
ncbi:MAG: aspartate aminotransferase family protein [Flavobacteriaceae bacterium]|nr:aspartate aminotransferase family protein [Flavobacteriaceae bacterium]